MLQIRKVQEEDFEQIHQLRAYSFPLKYNEARKEDFQYWIAHSTTLGAYDGKKVVGQLLILPLNITIQQKNYSMGGIAFVASYPEYRKRGIAKNLMIESLRQMYENGQIVSVLAPFSKSFYRHFGWELFFDKVQFTITSHSVSAFGGELDQIVRTSFTLLDEELFAIIKDFHNERAGITNGYMVRDEAWWRRLASKTTKQSFCRALRK